MKLGVVIPTYRRLDNRTPSLLKRALDSVFKQTYQDFKIFLIGDKYDREQEVKEILSKYPLEKIYFENLPYAAERDKYHNKWVIWSYGGVNAINHGIDVALNENYEFICHLDHDDYWDDCHLEEIFKSIITTNSDWICTKAKYINELVYPSIECSDFYCEYSPKPERLIHSSVCMNFKKIPLKYRDIYKETGKIGLPSDADLWVRVSDYCKNNNIKTTLINKITCYHTEEGYERK